MGRFRGTGYPAIKEPWYGFCKYKGDTPCFYFISMHFSSNLFLLLLELVVITMKFSSLLTLVSLVNLAAGLPSPGTHAIHEKRRALSNKWTKRTRVESSAILPVKIGKHTLLPKQKSQLFDI